MGRDLTDQTQVDTIFLANHEGLDEPLEPTKHSHPPIAHHFTTYPRLEFILEAANHISVRPTSHNYCREEHCCRSLVLPQNSRHDRRPVAQGKTPTLDVCEFADLDLADLQYVYPADETSKLETTPRLAQQGRQTAKSSYPPTNRPHHLRPRKNT
ncbi:hypothetical protein PtA15_15A47 [Puccinia triticina]|uniref:Uncharacterized protein n=1 Tax=Puccinia triticina TaxID=208348 RepID=A0ABY7D239_9BASI|nr:uncharacterized protein PtA15_15A47 [Puccinia triticina]WAQ91658.1 hypothetical protein PtA15_15A47 [Puccinia triticina]WAR62457.1 hypothetical protein PtB15_15B41 [Puccinia triticina]